MHIEIHLSEYAIKYDFIRHCSNFSYLRKIGNLWVAKKPINFSGTKKDVEVFILAPFSYISFMWKSIH